MSEAAAPTAGDGDPLWRMRWMLLAGMILVLAALGLMVSMHHTNWKWPLFFWASSSAWPGLPSSPR